MAGVQIQFPTTLAPVALRGNMDRYSVAGFFGPNSGWSDLEGFSSSQSNLRNYLRGGNFVPDGPAGNASLPASGPISLAELAGRYAYLEVEGISHPGVISYNLGTAQGANFTPVTGQFTFALAANTFLSHHTYAHATWRWSYTYNFLIFDGPTPANYSDPNQTIFSNDEMFRVRFIMGVNATCWVDIYVTLEAKSNITGQTHALTSALLRLKFNSLL